MRMRWNGIGRHLLILSYSVLAGSWTSQRHPPLLQLALTVELFPLGFKSRSNADEICQNVGFGLVVRRFALRLLILSYSVLAGSWTSQRHPPLLQLALRANLRTTRLNVLVYLHEEPDSMVFLVSVELFPLGFKSRSNAILHSGKSHPHCFCS
jgi:hypothetical protein